MNILASLFPGLAAVARQRESERRQFEALFTRGSRVRHAPGGKVYQVLWRDLGGAHLRNVRNSEDEFILDIWAVAPADYAEWQTA